jgi:hypothetical protein
LLNLILHADHACPHKSDVSQQFITQNAMAIAAHRRYSDDLTPSDFYLFGHTKGPLMRESFETDE